MNQQKKVKGRSAFEQVYRDNIGILQHVTRRYGFAIQVQEDLIQEVFLRYLQYQETVADVNPRSYLITVARHLAVDIFRYQKSRRMDMHVPIEDWAFKLPDLRDDGAARQKLAVQFFLQTLKDDPKASTLVQYYDEDLSLKEVAARSNESIATVSSRLTRQRKKYRAKLEACLDA